MARELNRNEGGLVILTKGILGLEVRATLPKRGTGGSGILLSKKSKRGVVSLKLKHNYHFIMSNILIYLIECLTIIILVAS